MELGGTSGDAGDLKLGGTSGDVKDLELGWTSGDGRLRGIWGPLQLRKILLKWLNLVTISTEAQ